MSGKKCLFRCLFCTALLFIEISSSRAQTQPPTPAQCIPAPCPAPAPAPQAKDEPRLEIYGFVMTDFGYNVDTIDPLWFDIVIIDLLVSSDCLGIDSTGNTTR